VSTVPGPASEQPGETAARGGTARSRWRTSTQLIRSTRQRVADTRRRLEDARLGSRPLDAAFTIGERDVTAGGSLLAGALAFRLFLWMLPTALVLVAGLGFAAAAGGSAAVDAAHAAGLRSLTASSINQAAAEAERGRWVLLIVGLWLLYLASVALAKALVAATALAWGSAGRRVRRKPIAAVILLGYSVIILVVAALAGYVRHRNTGLGVVVIVLLVVVWAGLWWLASWLLPHGDAPPIYLLPGAVLVGVGVQVLYAIEVIYLNRRITTASALYGSLGAAATLLLATYLVSRLLMGSAVVNAVLWERHALRDLIDLTGPG
jgi:uncharacterized BrkB/YihY/UPF0761 family membrane protein